MSIAKKRAIRESPLYDRGMKQREQQRCERKCFWTWPLGHHYYERNCVFCKKVEELNY